MSAPTVSAPPVAPASGSSGRRGRSGTGAVVAVLVIVGAVAALVLAAVVIGGSNDPVRVRNQVPGDPANVGTDGTAALTETLKRHGVRLHLARTQEELGGTPRASSSTVVVISRASGASKSSTRILRDKSRDARRIVLLDPRADVLAQFGLAANPYPSIGAPVSPTGDCTAAGINPRDRASSPRVMVLPEAGHAVTRCFPGSGQPAVAAVAVFPAAQGRPEIVVAPQDWFTNGAILENDQAGIAVRMIGAGDSVHWFAPSFGDLANDDPEPQSKPQLRPDIPRWLWPMVGLGAVVLFALMLWRGRRFGQLVTEPLPAVVKAAETTEARGRLYQASGDARRAADQLRNHALRTIPRRLGVSRHAPVEDVVTAVARATGRDYPSVFALLAGPLPTTNDGLVAFATDLSTLEEEVRPVL